MTVSLLLSETSVLHEPLVKLAKSFHHDREAYLQLLLDISKKSTFKRIIRCPTYPVRVVTPDLEQRRQLLFGSIVHDRYDISYVLAFLYDAAIEIERKKDHGQFFTPAHVARKATENIDLRQGETLMDAGCGTGIFPLTILKQLIERHKDPASFGYLGIENDMLLALCTAVSLELAGAPLNWRILFTNYLSLETNDIREILGQGGRIGAVISNPPFVRSQRLGERTELASELGLPRTAGLHSFFLAYSFKKLAKRCKMLFIMPLEMNGTQYGSAQLEQLKTAFRLDNQIIYYDERGRSWNSLAPHQVSLDMHTLTRYAWNLILFHPIIEKRINATISKKVGGKDGKIAFLGHLADVHRGISTGSNSFFVLTDDRAKELGVWGNTAYLRRIVPTKIPKIRLGIVLDEEAWKNLKKEGKACWLLSLPERAPLDSFPSGIREYLKTGERLGIHLIPTCKERKNWYSVRVPNAPDMFFTYVSRGFPIFTYNEVRAHNLTNLLGIYLKFPIFLEKNRMKLLAELLNSEMVKWVNQNSVGRKYKGGLIKFEPSDLERMAISVKALNSIGINLPQLLGIGSIG